MFLLILFIICLFIYCFSSDFTHGEDVGKILVVVTVLYMTQIGLSHLIEATKDGNDDKCVLLHKEENIYCVICCNHSLKLLKNNVISAVNLLSDKTIS